MMIVACMHNSSKRKVQDFEAHYPTLGLSAYRKKIFVIFNDVQSGLLEGISRRRVDLAFPLLSVYARIHVRAKRGITDIGDRYVTTICSPEGTLGTGEPWGRDGWFYRDEVVSVRAYQRPQGVRFPIPPGEG